MSDELASTAGSDARPDPTGSIADRHRTEMPSPVPILESLGEGVYTVDREGLCTFVNGTAVSLLGYDAPADLLGRDIHGLIHHTRSDGTPYPADRSPAPRAAGRGEPVLLDDELLRRRDGSSFLARYASHPLVDGDAVVGSVVRFDEATSGRHDGPRSPVQREADRPVDREEAQARLRDSETLFAAVMQTALDGIVVIGEDTRIVEFNPAAERTFRWTRETALGQELGALILPADFLVGHLRKFARFLEDGEVSALGKHVEVEAERSDGERFPAELAVTPFKIGDRPMFAAYMRDITDRKRAERDLASARDEALEANRAKSQFLANMSHELRTPLSAIIGYSEMLQEEMQDGGDTASFAPDMAKVESNARHLLGLINDVLDLSKIESGKMEVFAEDFDVEAMVRDVASTVTSLVEKKGNVLALDTGPGLGAMRSDLTKVKQMLLNLLSNASKFTEGGTIALSAERGPGPDGHDEVRFRVGDSGIGMTEEQMAKLFQRFTQAEASTSGKFGGTGLGLSISKAFAVMLGGDIAVSSHEGQGSVFTIALPATSQV